MDGQMQAAIIEAAVKRTVVALKHTVAQIEEFEAKGLDGAPRLLDVIMPNGKRLADCTGEEAAEFARLFTEVGDKMIAEGR